MIEFKMSEDAYNSMHIFIAWHWSKGNAIRFNISDKVIHEAEFQIYIDNEVY